MDRAVAMADGKAIRLGNTGTDEGLGVPDSGYHGFTLGKTSCNRR